MARVKMVHKDQASQQLKEIYDKIEHNGARVLNLYRVLAHNPDVLLNHMRLGNSLITKSGLSPRLRELAILRVASITGSEYEWAQHYPVALEIGIRHEQIEAISHWSESTEFSDEEQAVLRYTDEVEQNVRVQDETFRTLRQHLNEQNIVELTVSVGYWGMVARLLVSLQVDVDIQSVSSARELTGHRN